MRTYTYTDVLQVLECARCHISFAVPQDFMAQRRRDHQTFYCPNKHPNYYPQESKEEELARELKHARSREIHLSDQLEAEKRSKAAIRGHLTRMRNRIINGVCPWCNRSFRNVHDHVHHMHPEHVDKLEEVMSNE